MSLIQVGLVDKTKAIDPELMQAVAAALTIQVTRDLPQFWNVQATVTYEPNASKIPPGVWPVFLVKTLPPGEGGFHLDQHNQPYAKVIASPGSDEWTIDASHETLEMLVDPYGNRLQGSRSISIAQDGTIEDGVGEYNYLVEACDPCEADAFAYSISGVAVSDFITPHFYDPVTTAGTRYSFTGAITAPRQLLKGGYISYIDLATNQWQQILWVNPGPPVYNNLGPAAKGKSLREWIDIEVAKYKNKTKFQRELNQSLLDTCDQHRTKLSKIAVLRAKRY